MTNKEIAVSFLKMAGSGAVESAYRQFVAQDFIHHNQHFKGDRQSLMEAMIEAHKVSPNLYIEIKNIYEAQNTVVTHALVKKASMDIAVIHIFRFDKNKIVELWDLGQVIDSNSPNENGLF